MSNSKVGTAINLVSIALMLFAVGHFSELISVVSGQVWAYCFGVAFVLSIIGLNMQGNRTVKIVLGILMTGILAYFLYSFTNSILSTSCTTGPCQ